MSLTAATVPVAIGRPRLRSLPVSVPQRPSSSSALAPRCRWDRGCDVRASCLSAPHRTRAFRLAPPSVERGALCSLPHRWVQAMLYVVCCRVAPVRSLIVLVTFSLAGALGSGASRNVWAAADVRRTACSTAHRIQHTTRCEGLAQCRGRRSLTRIGRCAAQSILQQNLAVEIRAWLPSATGG